MVYCMSDIHGNYQDYKFLPEKPLSDYATDDFLWGKTDYETATIRIINSCQKSRCQTTQRTTSSGEKPTMSDPTPKS